MIPNKTEAWNPFAFLVWRLTNDIQYQNDSLGRAIIRASQIMVGNGLIECRMRQKIMDVKPVMHHIDKASELVRIYDENASESARPARIQHAWVRCMVEGRPQRRWSDDMGSIFQQDELDLCTATQQAKQRSLHIFPRRTLWVYTSASSQTT